MSTRDQKIAVVGLGALGLVALKNLLEEGFDATGIERNPYPGGLWKYTEDNRTSVLQSTIVNISKERGCFTDFPFPEGTSTYPTAAEVQEYLLSYVKHFQLEKHMLFGRTVERVTRDDESGKWVVVTLTPDGTRHEAVYDKVVIANGANNTPNIPDLQGASDFQGRILHSVSFKKVDEFQDKKVMVVGLGNTAADVSTSLVGTASKIYLAHRLGSIVVPRILPSGGPLDHSLSYRKTTLQYFMMTHFPEFADRFGDRYIKGIQDKSFHIRPEWKLSPAPSLVHHVPIISDTLVDELESGNIVSIGVPSKVQGPSTVELERGPAVEVDAVIWCTGYNTDYSILGEFDPTLNQHSERSSGWSLERQRVSRVPRLYRNIFSLQHPESLAFLGTAAFPAPAFQVYDIATMAVAQLWKTPSRFPPKEEMQRCVDKHIAWTSEIASRGSLNPRWVHGPEWMAWAEEAAGLGVSSHLGYGVAGWRFWLGNQQFCESLMDGILSPHLYRLFEGGGRKPWPGARDGIEKLNREANERWKPDGKKGA